MIYNFRIVNLRIGEAMDVTVYDKELLIESIQYRLESDKTLLSDINLREDLEDLLFKVEESDDYV